VQALYCMLPTASEAVGRLTQHEAYIGYLPLAHVLEMLAEFTMLVLGVPIGYSTTNTLLDTSTMIARGCKVCVSTRVAINCKECTKTGILGVPIGYSTTNTLLDTSTMIARGCKVYVGTKVAINCKECAKSVFWSFPLVTQQPVPC
jgi:hypothetical protein